MEILFSMALILAWGFSKRALNRPVNKLLGDDDTSSTNDREDVWNAPRIANFTLEREDAFFVEGEIALFSFDVRSSTRTILVLGTREIEVSRANEISVHATESCAVYLRAQNQIGKVQSNAIRIQVAKLPAFDEPIPFPDFSFKQPVLSFDSGFEVIPQFPTAKIELVFDLTSKGNSNSLLLWTATAPNIDPNFALKTPSHRLI